MKRYVWLLLAGAIASAAGVLAFRSLRWPAAAPEAVASLETTSLSFVLGEAGIDPAASAVPNGHRVVLAIHNGRSRPVTLVLQGYEDRFGAGPIGPGKVWRGEFVADRPGDAFAWLADGVTVGRLSVTGSHLVEGHR